MKHSLLYMVFEGLSKGGNHLLLLFIASYIDPSIYLVIMLLISFETLLPVFVISNYNEVLYTLKDKFNKEDVFSTVLSISLSMSLLYLILVFAFENYLFEYFDYNNLWVYGAIVINIFFFVYFRFISIFHQLDENHNWAIYLKSLPFFLAFLGVLMGMLFFEDKVAGFFVGKLLGYIAAFLVFSLKNKVFEFSFRIDKDFFIDYVIRAKYLVFLGVFGWLSGYGFLNIVKLISTDEQSIVFGYMLNVYMVFLLIANGVNQVYVPRLRKVFMNSKPDAVRFSSKVIVLYVLLITVLGFLAYVFHEYLFLFKDVVFFALYIFLLQVIFYVYSPYYYLVDKYSVLVKSVALSDCLSIAFIFFIGRHYYSGLMLYSMLITLRSIFVFAIYSNKIKTRF